MGTAGMKAKHIAFRSRVDWRATSSISDPKCQRFRFND